MNFIVSQIFIVLNSFNKFFQYGDNKDTFDFIYNFIFLILSKK